jgi:hypothetical protein
LIQPRLSFGVRTDSHDVSWLRPRTATGVPDCRMPTIGCSVLGPARRFRLLTSTTASRGNVGVGVGVTVGVTLGVWVTVAVTVDVGTGVGVSVPQDATNATTRGSTHLGTRLQGSLRPVLAVWFTHESCCAGWWVVFCCNWLRMPCAGPWVAGRGMARTAEF